MREPCRLGRRSLHSGDGRPSGFVLAAGGTYVPLICGVGSIGVGDLVPARGAADGVA